jgi:hypothetical protein
VLRNREFASVFYLIAERAQSRFFPLTGAAAEEYTQGGGRAVGVSDVVPKVERHEAHREPPAQERAQ